jgi:hypothetical protein
MQFATNVAFCDVFGRIRAARGASRIVSSRRQQAWSRKRAFGGPAIANQLKKIDWRSAG